MKLLLDQSVPAVAAKLLRDLGYDAVHGSEIGMSVSADIEYLHRAASEGSVVVTLDADFHDALTKHAMTAPSTIHLRLHNPDDYTSAAVIDSLCRDYQEELSAGCVITYKGDSPRLRRLPIKRASTSWKPRLR